jgi:hypothetical protein
MIDFIAIESNKDGARKKRRKLSSTIIKHPLTNEM